MEIIRKPLSLIIMFNLFFLIIIVIDENSRQNFTKLGATLQNVALEFKIIINLFFIFALFIVYQVLQYFFDLKISKYVFFHKYHKHIMVICIVIFCFIPASIFLGYQYGLIDLYFRAFGVGHIKPNFVDLRGTLAAINKVNVVGEGYQIDCPNKPCIGWRWTYGSSILKLKSFDIFHESATYVFAFLLLIIFLYVVFKLSNNFQSSILFLMLIPTGTLMLIIERMNIDILLILLIYYLALTINKKKIFLFIAPIPIFLAATVKYYPLILIFPLLILIQSKILRIYYLFIFLAGVIYIIPELKLAGIDNFDYGYSATYGLKNLIGLVNGSSQPKFVLSLLTLVGFMFFLFITYFIYKNYNLSIKNDQQSSINFPLYIYGFTILLSSWVINSNYPYRLICVLPMIPFLIDSYNYNKEIVLTALSAVIVFFGVIPVTLSPVRNLTLSFFVALNLGILSKIFFEKKKRIDTSSINSNKTSRN